MREICWPYLQVEEVKRLRRGGPVHRGILNHIDSSHPRDFQGLEIPSSVGWVASYRIETLNVDGFPLIYSSWWKDKRKPNSYGPQCWTSLNSCHQRTIELIELKRVSFMSALYYFSCYFSFLCFICICVCHVSVYINTLLKLYPGFLVSLLMFNSLGLNNLVFFWFWSKFTLISTSYFINVHSYYIVITVTNTFFYLCFCCIC